MIFIIEFTDGEIRVMIPVAPAVCGERYQEIAAVWKETATPENIKRAINRVYGILAR